MRALLVAALLLLGAAAVLPTAVEAQPVGCRVTSFDPSTGDGTAVCGPYFCEFGPDYGFRCFG